MFSRWEDENKDIPYALVITIEDLSGSLDIYNEIRSQNRYELLNSNVVRVRNKF